MVQGPTGTQTEFEEADHELTDEEIRQKFGWLIDEFIHKIDSSNDHALLYATAICESAQDYLHKQSIWDVRMEVSRAEQEARNRCNIDHKNTEQFTCRNESPCGFGHCPYAKQEHTFECIPTKRKGMHRKRRPRPAVQPEYILEDALDTMLKMRGITVSAA